MAQKSKKIARLGKNRHDKKKKARLFEKQPARPEGNGKAPRIPALFSGKNTMPFA
jgi:hypothetical protein